MHKHRERLLSILNYQLHSLSNRVIAYSRMTNNNRVAWFVNTKSPCTVKFTSFCSTCWMHLTLGCILSVPMIGTDKIFVLQPAPNAHTRAHTHTHTRTMS